VNAGLISEAIGAVLAVATFVLTGLSFFSARSPWWIRTGYGVLTTAWILLAIYAGTHETLAVWELLPGVASVVAFIGLFGAWTAARRSR
jgi:hypothetical protein